jgi:hypothetical protein
MSLIKINSPGLAVIIIGPAVLPKCPPAAKALILKPRQDFSGLAEFLLAD